MTRPLTASVIDILLLGLIGIVVGGVGTLLGIGGGFIVVPVLLSFYNFAPGNAAGTSLLVVLMNAISGTAAYLRQRRVDLRMGLGFTLGTIPGSALGSISTTLVSGGSFRTYFALMLIFTALYMVFRHRPHSGGSGLLKNGQNRRLVDQTGREHLYIFNPYLAVISSLLAGFIAGFFGVGGGIVHVPIMIILFGVPAHIATATSHFILTLTAASGIATHALLGHIEPLTGGIIAAGALLGAQIGAKVSARVAGRAIELLFAVMLIAIAVNLLLQSMTA
ncbi:MAG: sulfite exporter TauE/SafE family protein [Nitrososphaerota archaeon]